MSLRGAGQPPRDVAIRVPCPGCPLRKRLYKRSHAPAFCMSLRASAHTGVAIRSPAAVQNEKQYFWQIRGSLRIRPKCYFFLPFSAGRGLRTSDRCHWFAMTCGNLPGVRTVPVHCWAKTCWVSAQYHRPAWPPISRIFPRFSPQAVWSILLPKSARTGEKLVKIGSHSWGN